MRLPTIRSYFITSSEGDMCYTLKKEKTNQDPESENYGQKYDVVLGKYPTTIKDALNIIYEIEKFNSKVGDGRSKNKAREELWMKYIQEVKSLKSEIHLFAESIGIDKLNLRVDQQSKEFLSQGDPPVEEKPKRGRKRK